MNDDDFKDFEEIDFGEGAPMAEPPKPPLKITLRTRKLREKMRIIFSSLPDMAWEWWHSKRDIEKLRRREKRDR